MLKVLGDELKQLAFFFGKIGGQQYKRWFGGNRYWRKGQAKGESLRFSEGRVGKL